MKNLVLAFCLLPFAFCLSSGAQSDVYESRRNRVFDEIGTDVAVVKNAGRDYLLPTSINWNYYYLTGDQSEGAVLVLNGSTKEAVIYKTPALYQREIADIPDITVKPLADFDKDIPRLLMRSKSLWMDFSAMINLDNPAWRLNNLPEIKNISPFLQEQRKIKDEWEMKLLRQSIQATADGLVEVMKAVEAGINEKDCELILNYKFQKAGCDYLGFGIQAASGPNATSVHYGANDRKTQEGDMMVFDVGARAGYYSADISRSFPVSGKFTKEQKEIYELVLTAQKAAIQEMKPGVNIQTASNTATEVLNKGLLELGLLTNLEQSWQKRFWIQHGFFHYIGLVVHDVGSYGGVLEPGMILTMEPGLYFPSDYFDKSLERLARTVDEKELKDFRDRVHPLVKNYINIGVRIEDDVYITAEGNEVLSKGVPKEVNEIEKLMKEKSFFNQQ